MTTLLSLTTRTILLFATLMAAAPAWAQEDEGPPSSERLQEIRAQRSAYLTTRLKLTPEEAQRFWPVYNEFDEAREALRGEMRGIMRGHAQADRPMSEQDALKALDQGLEIRQRELDLERTYKDRFVKLIGAERTLTLHRAERDFQKDMLRRFRKPDGGREGPPHMMHRKP